MRNPILVALDVPTLSAAMRLVEELRDVVGGFKVGLELCTSVGVPQVVDALSAAGGSLFVDLKLKDIPNTVAGAARGLVRPGVAMFNVHADGGTAMMRAAAEAVQAAMASVPAGMPRPLVLGVTVLTSIDAATLRGELQVAADPLNQVTHLAQLAHAAGLDGVVCSAHEVAAIRAACGSEFITVVPGIRPEWAEAGDQRRVLTPADALRTGADYLVIGRPITRPPTSVGAPIDAARRILDEILAAREARVV